MVLYLVSMYPFYALSICAGICAFVGVVALCESRNDRKARAAELLHDAYQSVGIWMQHSHRPPSRTDAVREFRAQCAIRGIRSPH